MQRKVHARSPRSASRSSRGAESQEAGTQVNQSLDAIFNPRGIAVVGASNAVQSFGGRRFRSLIEGGYAGAVYPIHPSAPEVQGHQAFPQVRDLPGPVDLAVIMVRSDLVDAVIDDCAALGVPGVLVLSGGFGETGPEGRERERVLTQKLHSAGGRMLGPNCVGLYSGAGRVNVMGWRSVPQGPVALISQSGNMARTFALQAQAHGVGFSKIISTGNAADLKPADYIEYLFTDPDTQVIVAYVEGFGSGEGRTFFELLRDHPQRKPVILLKPGVTESGRRAALSHTGTLAGEERIVDAALKQCGALRAPTAEEAWAAAMALVGLPRLKSSAVVVVSDGGGHATIVSDATARAGLSTPDLSEKTQAALAELLPPRSTVNNPVDFAGKAEQEPEVIPRVIDVCLADVGIGSVILAGHFGGYFKDRTEETARRELASAQALVAAVAKHGKPFVLHTEYAFERLPTLEPLRAAGVPAFASLELSARALGYAWRYASYAKRKSAAANPLHPDRAAVAAILQRAEGVPRRLAEPEARALLELYGVPVPPWRVARSVADAQAAAKEFAVPAALKLISPDLVHKSDVGGVLLGIDGAAAAGQAYEKLMETAKRLRAGNARVLVTPMIGDGVAVVVGGLRDEQFGAVVMCGLGGIYVEVLDDIAFRVAPVNTDEAAQMLDELRSAKLFGEFRGRPAVDTRSLAALVARVSELLTDVPEIVELDLNPVFVRATGMAVADARIVLG